MSAPDPDQVDDSAEDERAVRPRRRLRPPPALRPPAGADVIYGDLGHSVVPAVAGDLAGGLLLMTLTHTVQAKSAHRSG